MGGWDFITCSWNGTIKLIKLKLIKVQNSESLWCSPAQGESLFNSNPFSHPKIPKSGAASPEPLLFLNTTIPHQINLDFCNFSLLFLPLWTTPNSKLIWIFAIFSLLFPPTLDQFSLNILGSSL